MPGGAIFSFLLVCFTYMPATILFAYFVSFMFDKWETAQAAQPMIFFLVSMTFLKICLYNTQLSFSHEK